MEADKYYYKYLKYKSKYIALKGGNDNKKYKCGRYSYEYTPKPVPCDNKGNINSKKKINGEKYYGWNLLDYLECSDPKYYKKNPKTFKISDSKSVIVSDVVHNPIQREEAIKNVKPGSYNLFTYKNPLKSKSSTNIFYIILHTNYKKEDIKSLKWICKGTFNTDIANAGLYDEKYYNDPNELKDIKPTKDWKGWNCKDKVNSWNDCKRLTISLNSPVILPHGCYVSMCGDSGYRYWIAKNKNKQVIGFGFRYC